MHRLDAITSGLLLFARDPATAAALGRAWQAGEVGKLYLAIAPGKPSKKQRLGEGRYGKIPPRRLEAAAQPRPRPSPGLTASAWPPGLRLYLLRPFTGRTHQLRVALKKPGRADSGRCAVWPGPATATVAICTPRC